MEILLCQIIVSCIGKRLLLEEKLSKFGSSEPNFD